GQRLGIDRIYDYASRFGLGKRSGLDLTHESPGLFPSSAWKKKHFAGTDQAQWFPGETLSVAIGQGATMVTPLQMAVAMSALVNGGKVYRPYLVQAVLSGDGKEVVEKGAPKLESELQVSESVLQSVRAGLESVVNNPEGTARRAQLPKNWGITTAGKTGTSQVVALSKKKDSEKDTEHHAWFVGYAPAENPEIVVATLVEHGGGGGLVAAPVVRQVFEAYFKKTRGLKLPEEEEFERAQAEGQAHLPNPPSSPEENPPQNEQSSGGPLP
ncbi:MAG: hypothetical protein KDD60_06090, partial [Bdellovibrionales bacterium]|nr:hypothetical protein [Bdellovibrionales bacterium]